MELRPYQVRDLQRLRAAFRQHRSVLYQAPTGSGKTVLFTKIAHGASDKGKRVWILVHRAELIYQTSAALDEQRVAHGIICAGFTPEPLPNVQIASVQSLVKRLAELHPPDLIVVDEAHHSVAGSWRAILDSHPSARVLGVTATPLRLDGQGLRDMFQAMVIGPSVQSLIAAGFLAPPVIYGPPAPIDLSAVKSQMGDYAHGALERTIDKPSITGDAVAHYSKLCPRVPAIAFCTGIEHAKHVTEQFIAAGYPWGLLVGKPHMTDAQRREAVRNLSQFIWRGVSTVDLVSEGFDLPAVECAIMLRPTQSLGLHLQQIGRALRPSPGKTRAVILDHAGNCLRHGLPQEDREWSLDGKPAADPNAEKAPLIRQCPKCYRVHPPAPRCPECGYVYEIIGRAVAEKEGELQEITPEEMERRRAIHQRKAEEGRAQTREELEALAAERGYHPRWVEHRMAAREQRRMRG